MTAQDPTALLGVWSFEREIDDLEREARSSASGLCELSPERVELILWRERATLKHGDREFAASRDLRIAFEDDAWHVRFDDGRYFHPWSPGEHVVHPCGEDIYEGLVEIDGPAAPIDPVNSWRVTWRIRGPRKNLKIVTRLSRV